ncbi:MAG TPA: hypothetical protein VJK51_05345 [Candidatus Nanoarchaeia archaeon]|nr:hypothetical protein [Candidatus Nanoarchaeia archaeon]
MSSEYIRLSSPEKRYGHKTMLEAQINLLSTLKRLKTYTQYRKQELTLKIELKRKMEEIKEHLDLLDKLLPHSELKIQKTPPLFPHQPQEKRTNSLDDELETLKRKIAALQSSM